jgi:hypothetical protein
MITLFSDKMCWYKIKIKNNVYIFRSDAIVTPEEEQKLIDLHCARLTRSRLLVECLKILKPYTEKIIAHINDQLQSKNISESGNSVIRIQ